LPDKSTIAMAFSKLQVYIEVEIICLRTSS